jgi:hypothetical protein
MDLLSILREQRASRFRELAGAQATVRLPISDRLLSRLVLEGLPVDGPVREVEIQALADNRFIVRLRLTRPPFLPSISVRFAIERQPRLPDAPIVGFGVELGGGLKLLAGAAIRMMGVLPPGIRFEGDRLEVDLRWLLERYNAADVLEYVQDLQIGTEERRFVVSLRARVPE